MTSEPLPVLAQLVNTLLPGADPPPSPGAPYPSATSLGVDVTVASLVEGLPEYQRREFAQLLRVIDSAGMNILLSGRPERFSRLDAGARENFLRRWSTSRLSVKRKGFQAAKRLAMWAYFSSRGPDGGHPLWERIHYAPTPASPPAPPPEVRPASAPDFGEIETDVCVVGSGAGGSVIAARTAAAGLRTVVLEAGPWISPPAYPRTEREGFDQLYLGRGVVPTSDSAISILAGATPGGGTAVNWMTCLPPRLEARREWASEGGMSGADGAPFDRALAAVSERLHVSAHESVVNPSNDALRRGCEALGYRQGPDWDIISRNAVGCAARCGSCMFGCPFGARQSGLNTFLEDAVGRGAKLFTSVRADEVEVEGGTARAIRATVRGRGAPRSLRVRARTIVLAGGALQTPALLRRSGVAGPGVGAGLRLDPTTSLVAEFSHAVRTWEGPPQTVGVYRFQAIDAGAHGPWLETAPAHPGLAAIATPWIGARDFLRLMERIERVATPIVLVRDAGEGRVTSDRDGRARIDYRLTSADRANLVRGQIETARILVAAGATRLLSLHTPYIEAGDGSRPVSPAELDRFVEEVRHAGIREHSIALFSAHPMGSARAGLDPRRSAARPTGEVHGVDGLWIGDGSLLPSAPGANPMLSIMATAWRTADALLGRLAPSGAVA